MTLGNRIKELRLQKLLSQEKIAEELGVSRQAVSKWETGLSYPDTENLIALSKVLGVSVEELIQIKTEEQKNSEVSLKENQSKKISQKSVFPTLFVVGLFALLVIFGGTALFLGYKSGIIGSNHSLPLITEAPSNTTEAPNTTQVPTETEAPIDYLNSLDSLQLQEVAQSFAKALDAEA